jgi:RNA polymerase sigma-70 factor, ECF subfamily
MSELERLYQSHGAALLAYLRRSFAWCGEPEDMLHDTFVQALRQRDRLEQAVSRQAWLFGIARHVGLTAARRHRPTLEIHAEQPAEAQNPELLAMRQAMADLPAELRQTLELRLHDRLSYEEIAEVLEIPIGTVRSRLHVAMIRLRRSMDVENNDQRSSGHGPSHS